MGSIKEIVTKEVFELFEQQQYKKVKEILRKLSFELGGKSTEEKRLVLFNLSVVCSYLGEYGQSKFYIREIKDIIEQDEEYINNNPEQYLKVMNNYIEDYKDLLSVEEKLKIYEDGYSRTCGDLQKIDQAICYWNNINLLNEDYEESVELIETIHNYILDVSIDNDVKIRLLEIQKDIIEDLNRLEDTRWYDEVIETMEILNSSNSCEVQG